MDIYSNAPDFGSPAVSPAAAADAIAARIARRANLRVRMERLVDAAGETALLGLAGVPRLRAISEAYNRLAAEHELTRRH